MPASAIDMVGQRFGRLLVIARHGACALNGGATWSVVCDCGRGAVVPRGSLISGRTKSCGCLAAEAGVRNAPIAHAAATKHGQHLTRLYRAWTSMKSRCLTPSAGNYSRYGAKGVRVCDEWQRSFEAFADHVGEPPTPKHTLDRKNPFGNYEPGNVRWATPKEQANNRRIHHPQKEV